MANDKAYPSSLIRFITSFDVDPDNSVVSTALDSAEFISRFYTPQLKVSMLSSQLLESLVDKDLKMRNIDLNKDSLLYKIQTSDLRTTKPYTYALAKTVALECFSIIFAVEQEERMLKYLNVDDIKRARTNLKYILDDLGDSQKYANMTGDIGKLDIALGYIQKQVPVLRGETNGTV